MPKGGPDVIDGLRKPGDFPDRAEVAAKVASAGLPAAPAPRAAAPTPAPTGVRRYESDIKALIVYIAKPKIYTVDGENIETEGKMAKFREGFFQTDDPEIIKKLDGHTGMGRDYWDVDQRRAQKEESAERLWLETVRANPHLLERLKVELGKQSFDLGGTPPAP
jgi:hypothetical protein